MIVFGWAAIYIFLNKRIFHFVLFHLHSNLLSRCPKRRVVSLSVGLNKLEHSRNWKDGNMSVQERSSRQGDYRLRQVPLPTFVASLDGPILQEALT